MTVSKNTLFEGKHVRLVSKSDWESVERVNVTGIVVILAITPDHEIVLTEQYRPPLEKNVIELPAGLVGDMPGEESESLETAACRELLEETGYEAGHLTLLTEGPPSAGLSNEMLTFFRAEAITRKTPGGGDESEKITVHVIPLGTAASWLEEKRSSGILIDPKVYTGLYFAGTFRE